MAIASALRAHAFTAGLSEPQIDALAVLAREVTFEENEVVLEDGQRSTSFYLVLQGSVVVELRAPRYGVSIQSLGAGRVFGWSSLLDRQDSLFRVRARELTRVLEINGAQLRQQCFQNPLLGAEIFHRVLHVVAGRVKATEERFAEMCGFKV